MGAWGVGNFQNDAALDWVEELERARSLRPIRKALELIDRDGDRYIDTDDACVALAAAEVVSALNLAPGKNLSAGVQNWVDRSKLRVDQDLLDRALRVVHRIFIWSELKDVYEELGSPTAEWHALLEDLEKRLKGGPNLDAPLLRAERGAKERRGERSTTRSRLAPGDVFSISLPDGRKAYGQFLQRGELTYLVQILDLITDEEVPVDQLRGAGNLFPPVYTSLGAAVKSGEWRVIGHLPLKHTEHPRFRATNGYRPGVHHDWRIWDGKTTTWTGDLPPEYRHLEEKVLWGYLALEERITSGVNPYEEYL